MRGRSFPAALALLAAVSVAGCTTSRWRFVRQRPSGKAQTLVTVTTDPAGAEITLNGNYLGESPLEVPVRYPVEISLYERRNALPYLHVESKELRTYKHNRFTFHAAATGFVPAAKTVDLHGEESIAVVLRLDPLSGE